jgi:tRNA nucleotidyltransferase (CCA-adding enzyme)
MRRSGVARVVPTFLNPRAQRQRMPATPDLPARTPVEKEVLKKITPGAKLPAIVARAIAQVERAIAQQQVKAAVRLGGSTAKGTYLAGDHDIDVFVRFSQDYDDAGLSDRLEALLTSVFDHVERVHGSRDYFHVHLGGEDSAHKDTYTFEFIPVIAITDWREARNVTDMSPLHVDYVMAHIGAHPALAADIRLTKMFCKSAKIYGAESYIGGFSGHVIDLLNIHYGGFHALLRAAAAWKSKGIAKTIIDPAGHHDSPLCTLNESKIASPIVIVDPIQPDRNSAAAVTMHAYERFIARAKDYLAVLEGGDGKQDGFVSGQKEFFTITPLSIEAIAHEHPQSRTIVIALTPQRGKKDVVGAKCYKIYQHCITRLLECEFTIRYSAWEFTPAQATLVFILPPEPLPELQEWGGPPVHKTEGVRRFTAAHSATYTRDGRYYAAEPRRYRDAAILLADTLKEEYVKSRVVAARIAKDIKPKANGKTTIPAQRRPARRTTPMLHATRRRQGSADTADTAKRIPAKTTKRTR